MDFSPPPFSSCRFKIFNIVPACQTLPCLNAMHHRAAVAPFLGGLVCALVFQGRLSGGGLASPKITANLSGPMFDRVKTESSEKGLRSSIQFVRDLQNWQR